MNAFVKHTRILAVGVTNKAEEIGLFKIIMKIRGVKTALKMFIQGIGSSTQAHTVHARLTSRSIQIFTNIMMKYYMVTTYITLEDADGVQEKEFVLCPIFTLLLFTHAICESPIVIFLWHP